ncbi:hypothetical protein HN460_02630 [bacterium]|nr:hypothetical protein [bacterium]MBT3795570.1 hypothetical protein [bacterium]MBT4634063.1 hypothetical protein [bacterium]
MFIPIISDLVKLRIRSNKISKYLTIYLILSSLFFLYKSILLIYILNGFLASFFALLIFPLTLIFYPLFLLLTDDYSIFFLNQLIYFFLPLALRILTKKSKRKYY